MCDSCDMHHGPAGHSSTEIKKVGRHEAGKVDISLPLKKRIVKEVENYNQEYGIASAADVTTEINSRGKDLQFQGELDIYAEKGEDRVQRAIDELVKEKKLRAVKVPGAKTGYVVSSQWRTNRKTGKRFPRKGMNIVGESDEQFFNLGLDEHYDKDD